MTSLAMPLEQHQSTRADITAGNIRAYAARAGFNQSALGRAIGLSQIQVHKRWTGATPWTINELDNVAAALGVSIFDLIADENEGGYAKPLRWITPKGSAARSKGLEPPTF